MKVAELMQMLSQMDQELEVAVCDDNDEYWGRMYSLAEVCEVRNESVNGPKRPGQVVVVIQ